MNNPLKEAREATRPKLSIRKAAKELGIHFTTLYRQELISFDPSTMAMADLEARAKLYGCSVNQLLGREPMAV